MSRLGKLPIKLPTGVSANLDSNILVVKGAKGEMRVDINPLIEIKIENNEIHVAPFKKEGKEAGAMWGLIWSLTRNAVIGVSEGFSKKLEINGVGYRASVAGNKLNMNLGFSHPIEYILPLGITATVEGNAITISGVDKQVVGEVAASIRKIRKPEPYKGKGIKYSDEIIRRKAGKAATKGK
ncbi:MAG: 50S ribosomal protein L6 [Patescibacteria group bacterium]|jgi:large subunit ribosomal protein L6|nr:50S ribosomal protein L6 [Patescibacteria group bacterium]MDD3778295.1 50S ribosomal protein L6 [Patescibacteria group bacterium]MDD3939305.1 50S ribosomal protein L6 [Patescibacteria group bacterium]MDD4443943.1 50S ribosomal protein L6 [Patescibacteria group bacterium]NCU39526.1 50S ribosomal protein L6 [Candidatus Falkowbacteria bacterium]